MEQQFVNICLKMVGFFGSLHSMPQQQRGRHAADAAGHGRAGGDGGGSGRHVAAQRAVRQRGRARVEHDLPWAHALRRDEPRRARRGQQNVGGPAAGGEVGRFPVAERHGRVRACEQQRGRPADHEAPAHDGHAPARGVDAVRAQQFPARLGRAGGEARRPGHERAERPCRHAVYVLARIERVEDLLRAQRRRQRPQQQHAVHAVVRAQGAQGVGQCFGRAVRRQGHGAHGDAAAGRRECDAAQIGPVVRLRADGHGREAGRLCEPRRARSHLRIDRRGGLCSGQGVRHGSALPAQRGAHRVRGLRAALHHGRAQARGARLGRGAVVRREQAGVDQHVQFRRLRRRAAQHRRAPDVRAQEGAGRAQRGGQQQRHLLAVLQHGQRGKARRVRRVREPGGARGVVLRDGVGPLQRQKARRVRVDEREQRRALRVAAGGQRGERVVPVGVAGVGCRHVRGHRGQARRQRPGERGRAPAARCGLRGGELRGEFGKGAPGRKRLVGHMENLLAG